MATDFHPTELPSTLNALGYEHTLDSLEVMLPDINGHLRGKVIQIDPNKELRDYRLLFPYSSLACDFTGDVVEETGLVWQTGDPDYPCFLELEHLAPIPWYPSRAQVMMRIQEPAGQPVAFDPREILRKLKQRFLVKGLTVTAAIELEFTLIPDEAYNHLPTLEQSGEVDDRPRLYDVEAADAHQQLFAAIKHAAVIQNIPADSLVTEAAPNQFEINLHHVADPLLAADQAILLKRMIKAVAKQYGHRASFMAKPLAGYPGNGLHIHMSISDTSGRNIFAPETPDSATSETLLHAIAGIQRTTEMSQILLYPNANSFKRIAPNNYAPCSTHWGHNNRNVALSIPGGEAQARRIEHRLAGADANPYLVMAVMLMGMDQGIMNPALPSQETIGSLETGEGIFLTQDPDTARARFLDAPILDEYFGEEFKRIYAICHQKEIARYQNHIMPIEYDWFFDRA